jgi:hypothetical protein
VVQFADVFECGLQFLVILQPPLDLRLHLWAEAELLGNAARMTDSEHPDRMTSAARAFGAAFLMADRALYQRTAQNFVERRDVRRQLFPLAKSLFMFHQTIETPEEMESQ